MKLENVPVHVAIIMDGNGRWAKSRHLPRTKGHAEGVKRVEELIESASSYGIKVLTLFTFSTENWTRPQQEVSALMRTLCIVLNKKIDKLNKGNIKFQIIGRKEGIPAEVLKTIDRAAVSTAKNSGMILNMAFNYGSRIEIIDAIRDIGTLLLSNKLKLDDVDEGVVSDHLYTSGLPDPDLLIRTSGEKRISNFLLWQLSYSELYFTETYWPDFTKEEFFKALLDFQNRDRRFGNVRNLKK